MANLAVCNKLAIDEKIEARGHTLKVEVISFALLYADIKIAHVYTARVFLRYVRRICRERIAQIGIKRLVVVSVCVHLPATRNLDCVAL